MARALISSAAFVGLLITSAARIASAAAPQLFVAAQHPLPFMGGSALATGVMDGALQIVVRSDAKNHAVHLSIDPYKGVLAQHELPQISDVLAGLTCGGALIITGQRSGSTRWQVMAISASGALTWQLELPVRGTIERLPIIACAAERAVVAWIEQEHGAHVLALLPLAQAAAGQARRTSLPDASDDLVLAGGTQLAALRTSEGQTRLEALRIDAQLALTRRPLRNGHVFAPFLIAHDNGWLMSTTTADSSTARVELQALDANFLPRGEVVQVANRSAPRRIAGTGLWISDKAQIVVGYSETAPADHTVVVERPRNGPARHERAFEHNHYLARFDANSRLIGSALQTPDPWQRQGNFAGDRLLLFAFPSRSPSVAAFGIFVEQSRPLNR